MLAAVYCLIYDDLSNGLIFPANNVYSRTHFSADRLRAEARQTATTGSHLALLGCVARISAIGWFAARAKFCRRQQHHHAGQWRSNFSGDVERNSLSQTFD